MTYRTEFPDFDPATLPAIPANWTEFSWHNDSSPSWNTGAGMIVAIDFVDMKLREMQDDSPRFVVLADANVHNHNDTLFMSDDWAEILAYVASNTPWWIE